MLQEEYPKNFEEFLMWFETENDCLEYIKRLRWPDGFSVPGVEHRSTGKRVEAYCIDLDADIRPLLPQGRYFKIQRNLYDYGSM